MIESNDHWQTYEKIITESNKNRWSYHWLEHTESPETRYLHFQYQF
jgi:hypothetical protein